jgi:hypothetical protein
MTVVIQIGQLFPYFLIPIGIFLVYSLTVSLSLWRLRYKQLTGRSIGPLDFAWLVPPVGLFLLMMVLTDSGNTGEIILPVLIFSTGPFVVVAGLALLVGWRDLPMRLYGNGAVEQSRGTGPTPEEVGNPPDRPAQREQPDARASSRPRQSPHLQQHSTAPDSQDPHSGESAGALQLSTGLVGRLIAAGVGGAAVVLALGMVLAPPVTIAIVAGALVAIPVAWTASYPRFAATGATYLFATAGGSVLLAGSLPDAYYQDAFVAAVIMGTVSGAIVLAQEGVGAILRRYLGDWATALVAAWQFASSVAGLIITIFTGAALYKKAARYTGIGIGGPGMLALNTLGIEIPAPLFFVTGVDAVVVAFVATTAIAFHTLDTLYSGWYLAKQGAKAGAKAGRAGVNKAQSAAESARDRADDS